MTDLDVALDRSAELAGMLGAVRGKLQRLLDQRALLLAMLQRVLDEGRLSPALKDDVSRLLWDLEDGT